MPATSTAVVGVKTMDQWREFVRARYDREKKFLNLEVSNCGTKGLTGSDLTSAAHARRSNSSEVQPSCSGSSREQRERNRNHVQTRRPITTTREHLVAFGSFSLLLNLRRCKRYLSQTTTSNPAKIYHRLGCFYPNLPTSHSQTTSSRLWTTFDCLPARRTKWTSCVSSF